MTFERDVVVVGGCGHVGLPLGLAFADRGLKVALFDLNERGLWTRCRAVSCRFPKRELTRSCSASWGTA